MLGFDGPCATVVNSNSYTFFIDSHTHFGAAYVLVVSEGAYMSTGSICRFRGTLNVVQLDHSTVDFNNRHGISLLDCEIKHK